MRTALALLLLTILAAGCSDATTAPPPATQPKTDAPKTPPKPGGAAMN